MKGPYQRADQRWIYAFVDENVLVPLGYCVSFRAWTPDDVAKLGLDPNIAHRWNMVGIRFCDRHHADGHATAEEAARCFLEYELDQQLRLIVNVVEDGKLIHCEWRDDDGRCPFYTSDALHVGELQVLHLCEEHRDREHMRATILGRKPPPPPPRTPPQIRL